jgi:hypothetical protein
MALSDEDKRRIEEEERFRAAARAKAEQQAKSKQTATGCLGCLGVVFVLWLIGMFTGSQKSDSTPPPAGSSATAPTAPKIDDAKCRQELGCWAEKFTVEASVRCKRAVEGLAKYQAEWTDGFLETKFSHYRWKNKDAGVVTYIGDKVKFQNGFGAWQMMLYECDFDTNTKESVDARARPGRLN